MLKSCFNDLLRILTLLSMSSGVIDSAIFDMGICPVMSQILKKSFIKIIKLSPAKLCSKNSVCPEKLNSSD